MGNRKRKSTLDAAHRFGLDEQMVSRDLHAISRDRRRVIFTALAISGIVLIVALVLGFTQTEQAALAFVSSFSFNLIAAVVAVTFLIFQIVSKVKNSDRL